MEELGKARPVIGTKKNSEFSHYLCLSKKNYKSAIRKKGYYDSF